MCQTASIEDSYHDSNPYHNIIHSTDVTQAMYCYLQEDKVACICSFFFGILTPKHARVGIVLGVMERQWRVGIWVMTVHFISPRNNVLLCFICIFLPFFMLNYQIVLFLMFKTFLLWKLGDPKGKFSFYAFIMNNKVPSYLLLCTGTVCHQVTVLHWLRMQRCFS